MNDSTFVYNDLHIFKHWSVNYWTLIIWMWKWMAQTVELCGNFSLPLEKKKTHILLLLLVLAWNQSGLDTSQHPSSNLYFSVFVFCVIVCHLCKHMRAHKEKEKKKNRLPLQSGCHDSSCLFLLIENATTVSPLAILIPARYWFCEWSVQTPRWQYWYVREDRAVFTSHPAPASSVVH